MQTIPREQLTKRFQLLPEALQNAIFSDQTADVVGKSCRLRDVDEDLISKIAWMTGRVLLGYLRPETFAFEIQKETGIDALKATQVAHDIDTEVFSDVRLELKKLYPPTIQTPTVQAPGFAFSSPQAISYQLPAKPRYVVPIPERFKKTTPWPQQPTTDNSQLIIHNKETLLPQVSAGNLGEQTPQEPKKSPAPEARAMKPETKDSGFKIQDTRHEIQKPASPPMDPIVPLPTFIQSKFTNNTSLSPSQVSSGNLGGQAPQPPETQDPGSKIQDSSKNDALKNTFSKFTTPSTATGITKEPESPYRETIEEPKKPTEQKPTAKVQGKVIDLSKF